METPSTHGISEAHPEEGLALMQRALNAAGVRPEEVVHVNAHGTGTPRTIRWRPSPSVVWDPMRIG
jgi:3-oxoacyl-(acyl-carrier-protein) synthase